MRVIIFLSVHKVELVGGESWLEHNSVAIAAITAAALAAFVAVANHRAQLRHDREMRNRDHVRDTIDNAIDSANRTRTAMNRFLSLLTTIEDRRGEPNVELPAENIQELIERREETIASIRLMASSQTRLAIRLGAKAPVAKAHKALLSAFLAVFKYAFKGVLENRPSDIREEDTQREQKLESAFGEFRTACEGWFADAPRRPFFRRRR